MNDTINNYLLPALTTAQKFFIQLLCEYYEEKLDNENEAVRRLHKQAVSLSQKNEELKHKISLIQEENTHLTSKLRSANNMIRILSSTKDNEEQFPSADALHLLEKRLSDKRKLKEIISLNFQDRKKQVTFNLQDDVIEPKTNMKELIQIQPNRMETRSLNNTLKCIQEKNKEIKSSLLQRISKIRKEPSILPPKISTTNILTANIKEKSNRKGKITTEKIKTVEHLSIFNTMKSQVNGKSHVEKEKAHRERKIKKLHLDENLNETYLIT